MSVASPSPRSEPLLWLQLLALSLLPLEVLLLLLLLGASDPGPLPVLERSLCWAIGVLAPAALLWRRPVDPFSLLVVQVPLRGRREIQQSLLALQPPAWLRPASLLSLAVLSLVLLWWCDDHAAFASAFSPVAESPRLVGLLLAALLLALLQWQGQQVVQALWLLSRSAEEVAAATPLAPAAVERERLSAGLPLLLLPALQDITPSPSRPVASPGGVPSPGTEPSAAPGDRSEAAESSSAANNIAEPEASPLALEAVAEAGSDALPDVDAPADADAEAEAQVVKAVDAVAPLDGAVEAGTPSEPFAEANAEAEAQADANPEVESPAEAEWEEPFEAHGGIAAGVDVDGEAHAEPAAQGEAHPPVEAQPESGAEAAAQDPALGQAQGDAQEGLSADFSSPSVVAGSVAVEPEQATEEQQGSALDEQIS